MNILIIGGSGMLGSQCVDFFASIDDSNIFVTCRKINKHLDQIQLNNKIKVYPDIDIQNINNIEYLIKEIKPTLVINCTGAIKQKNIGINPIDAISINGLFPHQLSSLADNYKFKLVLISTDCVFNGLKGNYTEEDHSDCYDIYGKSKYIGEIHDKNNVLTIRTSIIGIERETSLSLLSWFLLQKNTIKGYSKAIYSGVPTTYLAKFIYENNNLYGLYHLSSQPISKYHLLKLFAKNYDHNIEIIKDDSFCIDRSLDSKKLKDEMGFIQPKWETLVNYLPNNK